MKKICSYCLEEVEINNGEEVIYCPNCRVVFCDNCSVPLKKSHKICYNCGKVAPKIRSPLERVGDAKTSDIFDRWKSRSQSWVEQSKKPIYSLFKKAKYYILEKRKKLGGVLKRKLSNREVKKIEDRS